MRLKPLLGEQHFSGLIRTKPLARCEAYLVHWQILPAAITTQPLETANATVWLGMIVPKKAYALAVDRNRIRRVLRVQVRAAFAALLAGLKPLDAEAIQASRLPFWQVQCLFRVKTLPKQKARTGSLPNAAYLNPHSAQFTHHIQTLLAQTVRQALAAYAPISECNPIDTNVVVRVD